jgi:hypothetical protein
MLVARDEGLAGAWPQSPKLRALGSACSSVSCDATMPTNNLHTSTRTNVQHNWYAHSQHTPGASESSPGVTRFLFAKSSIVELHVCVSDLLSASGAPRSRAYAKQRHMQPASDSTHKGSSYQNVSDVTSSRLRQTVDQCVGKNVRQWGCKITCPPPPPLQCISKVTVARLFDAVRGAAQSGGSDSRFLVSRERDALPHHRHDSFFCRDDHSPKCCDAEHA